MPDGEPVPGSLYIYAPNKVAPIIFSVAFTLSGLFHYWQCYHYKCFKLMSLHLLCCPMFAAGFALREHGAFHYMFSTQNLNIHIASTCLIYMAPPLLELANYHILGRILYYIPYHSPLHPGRVLTTFGILSAIVEMLNAIGVSYIANQSLKDSLNKLGDIFMKISLIIQLVVIALFCVLAATFQYRCWISGIHPRNVSIPLWTLYTSTGLILVRCVYRLVEHFGASDMDNPGPIMRHEWFFYVFEASLMLVNSVLWNWFHPRRFLPEKSNIYLARDGISEVEGPGWKDTRPFLVTVMDPFGLFTSRKEKERPFWEMNG